jgi:GNAT superfamily N-acetyltransferase
MRLATRADVPAILSLLEDDEISRSRGYPRTEGADAALWRAFEAIDADPHNELIVAELDGTVVGTCQLTFTPSLSRGGAERMTIEAVRVSRDLRGGGIGRAMMRWALDRARERGCGVAQLTTDKRRGDAHRFYETLGFAASHVGMKLTL